jgi:hypothetical protein
MSIKACSRGSSDNARALDITVPLVLAIRRLVELGLRMKK